MTREELLRVMIDDYRRKIETYRAMIQEWERELGIQPPGQSTAASSGAGQKRKDTGATEPASLVSEYQFFSKSQPEAAKMFLELVAHPLRTQTILEGIEKGGVKVGGKTPKDKKQNLYTIMYRSDDFGIVAKDTWGLTTWPGVSKEKSKTAEGAIDTVQAGMKPADVVDEMVKK